MAESQKSILIAGCGYLGLRAAKYWLSQGHLVSAITRSSKRAGEFRALGITPIVVDLAESNGDLELPDADAILWAVGFDRSAGHSREEIWIDGLTRFVDGLAKAPDRFIYVSSTSVYGDQVGSEIDETSEPDPSTEGGRCCLLAEQLLRDLVSRQHPSAEVGVARMAGIYGPNRLLRRVEDLKAGKPLPGSSDQWLNLIHVDDGVRAVDWLFGLSDLPATLNVVNSGTMTRADYYSLLADLAGAPDPVFGGAETSRSRGGNKKVVSLYCPEIDFEFDDVAAGLRDAWARTGDD